MNVPVNLSANFFELFGLPLRFALDGKSLERSYHDLQARVHPDKFAHTGDAERRLSMQWATRVNEAYETLKSPLKRAAYLLELKGINLDMESNTAMPKEFLMLQMQRRETLEELSEEKDTVALKEMLLQTYTQTRRYYERLEKQLDTESDDKGATMTVRELMFLDKLREEIGEAIAEIED